MGWLKSWKTTLVGILTAICGGLEFGDMIPDEWAKVAHLGCATLIAFGFIAAKDGNVSHAPDPEPVPAPVPPAAT